MATFHATGKIELIILANKFGILHVIEKCLCAMFNFHPRTMHVKENAYDVNNNVIRFIYQVPVIGDLGLEWKLNVKRFKIIVFQPHLMVMFCLNPHPLNTLSILIINLARCKEWIGSMMAMCGAKLK